MGFLEFLRGWRPQSKLIANNEDNTSTKYDNTARVEDLRGYMVRYKDKDGKRPRILVGSQEELYELGHRISTGKLYAIFKGDDKGIVAKSSENDASTDISKKKVSFIFYKGDIMNTLLKFEARHELQEDLSNYKDEINVDNSEYTIQFVDKTNGNSYTEPERTSFSDVLKKCRTRNGLILEDLLYTGEINRKHFYKKDNPWSANDEDISNKPTKFIETIYFSNIDDIMKDLEILKDQNTKRKFMSPTGFRPSEDAYEAYLTDFFNIFCKCIDPDGKVDDHSFSGLMNLIAQSDPKQMILKDMFILLFEEKYGFIFDPYDVFDLKEDQCKIIEDEAKFHSTHLRIAQKIKATSRGGEKLVNDYGYIALDEDGKIPKNQSTGNSEEEATQVTVTETDTGATSVTTPVTTPVTSTESSRRSSKTGSLNFNTESQVDESEFWWPGDMKLISFSTEKQHYTHVPTTMGLSEEIKNLRSRLENPNRITPPPGNSASLADPTATRQTATSQTATRQTATRPTAPTLSPNVTLNQKKAALMTELLEAKDSLSELKNSLQQQTEQFKKIKQIKYRNTTEDGTMTVNINLASNADINIDGVRELLDEIEAKIKNISKLEQLKGLGGQIDLLTDKITEYKTQLKNIGNSINAKIWEKFQPLTEIQLESSNSYDSITGKLKKVNYEYLSIDGDTIILTEKKYDWDHTIYMENEERVKINDNSKVFGIYNSDNGVDGKINIMDKKQCDIDFKLLRKCFKPIPDSQIWEHPIIPVSKSFDKKTLCYDKTAESKEPISYNNFKKNKHYKIIIPKEFIINRTQGDIGNRCRDDQITGMYPFEYKGTHESVNGDYYTTLDGYFTSMRVDAKYDGYYMHSDLFQKIIGEARLKTSSTTVKELRTQILNNFKRIGWEYVAPDALRIKNEQNEYEYYGKSDLLFY